jgi:DNA replication protein DnaC
MVKIDRKKPNCPFCEKPLVIIRSRVPGLPITDGRCNCSGWIKNDLKLMEHNMSEEKKTKEKQLIIRAERMFSGSGLPQSYMGLYFKDRRIIVDEYNKSAYEKAHSFVNDFTKRRLIFIEGNPRTGKTVLAAEIMNEIMRKGFRVSYFEALSMVRNTSDNNMVVSQDKIKARDRLNALRNDPVVVINDITQADFSEAFRRLMFNVIDMIVTGVGRALVVTSKRPLDEVINKFLDRSDEIRGRIEDLYGSEKIESAYLGGKPFSNWKRKV